MRRAAKAAQVALALSLGAVAFAAPTPAGTAITNTAIFDADGQGVSSNAVTLTVQEVCGVAITPAQQQASGQVGRLSPFTFSVVNTGNAARTFPLEALAVLRGQSGGAGANVTLLSSPEQALTPASVTLAQGERRDVMLGVTPLVAGQAAGRLRVSCLGSAPAEGLAQVDAAMLPLTASKAVSADVAKPGDVLTYTITVTNPNLVAMSGVTVTDTLDAHLKFQSASPDAQVQGQVLTVLLPTIPAQGSATITVRAQLGTDADDLTVENTARASAPELPAPVSTNTVRTTVWDPRLAITKVSAQTVVAVGDTVDYTVTLTNVSKTAALDRVTLRDTLPQGLHLETATLRLGGRAAVDTDPDPRVIEVEGAGLRPGETAVLTYTTTVTPDAVGQSSLRNVALAWGVSQTRPTERVSTAQVDAIVKLASAERAVLLGRVYLDVDGDGRFGGPDRPVKGARVVVAGGEAALTDTLGRYAVPDLRVGRYAVALDRASVPYTPAAVNGDLQLTGTRLLDVYGVATADFPLLAPTGSGTAGRTTTVVGAGWRVVKTVQRQGPQVTVSLTLSAEAPVTLQLDDPLPPGAVLTRGEAQWRGALAAGQSTALQYTFTSGLPDAALTTDPAVRAQGVSK